MKFVQRPLLIGNVVKQFITQETCGSSFTPQIPGNGRRMTIANQQFTLYFAVSTPGKAPVCFFLRFTRTTPLQPDLFVEYNFIFQPLAQVLDQISKISYLLIYYKCHRNKPYRW